MFRALLFVVLIVSLTSPVTAETLTLISGQQVTGTIIEKNDMHLIVDVAGTPVTYFLGEVAAIDGQLAEVPLQEKIEEAPPKDQPAVVGGQDQESLVKFMTDRHVESQVPAQEPSMAPVKSCPKCPKPPVVTVAPDGGVIVVTHQKISKYDKDLKLIKEVPAP